MVDFITLLIGFILTLGMTYIAFKSNFRIMPSMICGAIWIAMAYMLLELNLIAAIVCIGMGFYVWARTFIS